MITHKDLLEHSILETVLSPLIKSKKVLNVRDMDEVFESLITEAKSKKLNTKLLNKGYVKHINTLSKKITQDFVYDFYFLNHQPAITSKKSAKPQPIVESTTTDFPYSITFTYDKGGFICEEFGIIPEEIDDESDVALLYMDIDKADIFDTDWAMEDDPSYGIKISTEDVNLIFFAEIKIEPSNTYTISRTIDETISEKGEINTYDQGTINCSNKEELMKELVKWRDSVNNAIANINSGKKEVKDINLNEADEDRRFRYN